MKTMNSRHPFMMVAVIFVFCMTTFMASMVEARGGRGGGGGGGMRGGGGGMRGGGGFSRSSPAAGGGFSSRPAVRRAPSQAPRRESPQAPRQVTRRELSRDRERDRGDRDNAREDRQQHRDDAREDRQDYLDDRWDDHHHHRYYGGAAYMTGTAGFLAGYNYVTSVPCETVVIVGRATYYNCSSTWYWRAMEGGEVVYLIVPAPPGY